MFEEFYKIKKENFMGHELIGLKAAINGREGVIRSESMKMLDIDFNGKIKKFQKEGNIFDVELPSEEKIRIRGNLLTGRPEDRTKQWFKKYYKGKK